MTGDALRALALTSLMGETRTQVRAGLKELPDSSYRALGSWLTDQDPGLQLQAASILIEAGRTDEGVFEALRSLLTEQDLGLRLQAARLLIEAGRTDEGVFEALRSWLTDQDPGLRHQAARLLIEAGRTEGIGAVIDRIQPDRMKAAEGLAACHRVTEKRALRSEDGAAIAALVKRQSGDTAETSQARQLLFDWLWGELADKAVV